MNKEGEAASGRASGVGKRAPLPQQAALTAASAESLREALQIVIDDICSYTGWPVGHAFLADAQSDVLKPTSIWHLDHPLAYEPFRAATERSSFESGLGLPGRVLESRTPHWIVDVTTDGNFPRAEAAAQSGLRAAFSFPIMDRDKVAGVLEFFSQTQQAPDRELLEIVDRVGRLLGGAARRFWAERELLERERAMAGQLRELEKEKARLLSTVSHELRTPLTSILGYLDWLMDGEAGPLNEEQAGAVEAVRRNSLRLFGLIEDLLTVARLESQAVEPSPEPVDLRELLRSVYWAMAAYAAEKGVQLNVDTRGGRGHRVLADRGQAERVILNLVSNALKFTPAQSGGVVTVSVRRVGNMADIFVEDTGVGIVAEEREKVFSIFHRGDTAAGGEVQGAGLGLAIARGLAESNDGRIWVDQDHRTGTKMVFELPLADKGALDL